MTDSMKRKTKTPGFRVARVAQILRVVIKDGITRVGYVDDHNHYRTGVLVSESAARRLESAK